MEKGLEVLCRLKVLLPVSTILYIIEFDNLIKQIFMFAENTQTDRLIYKACYIYACRLFILLRWRLNL